MCFSADLLGLLKWKASPDKISQHVGNLMKLNGEEVVKYLQDILDALFTMFSIDNGKKLPQADQIFSALVSTLYLNCSEWEHFKINAASKYLSSWID